VAQQRIDRAVAVIPIQQTDSLARLTIAGRSVLDGTVRALRAVAQVGPIVLAIEGDGARACLSVIENPGALDLRVVEVAGSRWQTIRAALTEAGDSASVLIQDPDRPLVSPAGIRRLLEEWRGREAIVTALPVFSSIKRVVNGRVVTTVPRDTLHAAQSPWVFDRSRLEAALDSAIRDGWPIGQELELARRAGIAVHLAEGHPYNVPIATHADARFAEMALERRLVAIPGGAAVPA
jgi:2-C-methyl-D-erythritol 4-phosphate cytidylyltransferase/2-C-methyl-D-erythritol 2,4-cyclodiphosphate synthase